MERTIISHDTTTGLAEVKFDHNGVSFTGSYDLKKVIPGSERILSDMGMEFTEELQNKALDYLTNNVQKQIEDGVITNPPEPAKVPEDVEEQVTEESPVDETVTDTPAPKSSKKSK